MGHGDALGSRLIIPPPKKQRIFRLLRYSCSSIDANSAIFASSTLLTTATDRRTQSSSAHKKLK